MGDNVKWLWKTSTTDSFYEVYKTAYRLALATAKPLLEEDITSALRHFYRKVPSLRTCFGERDGERWLREMPEENIDFEILPDDATNEEVFDTLLDYPYKSEGPLWCVKFKPSKMESSTEYSHVYDVFLGVNHVITDGTTNVMISGFFVQILDDVLGGKPIDDNEQLAVFIPQDKTEALIQEQVTDLEAKPELLSSLKEEFLALQSRRSLFQSIYKHEDKKEARTRMMIKDFDADTTSAFIKRCRAEGVTVNSAFTAIANLAMIDLFQEKGLVQDSYCIRSDHVLNARRFWEEANKYLGCHLIPLFAVFIETPRNAREDFWSYAKLANNELQKITLTNKLIQEEAMKRFISHEYNFQFEFAVTNMGNISKFFNEDSQNVRVLHVLRSSSIHRAPVTFSNFLHCLNGCLTYQLMHNSAIIDAMTAQKVFDLVVYYINSSLGK